MHSWCPSGQNLEDVFVYRCFKGLERGRYLDVGAGNPGLPSVTKSFYDIGWNGILVEASSRNTAQLAITRERDVVLTAVVGAEFTDAVFYEFEDLGISTLNRNNAEYFSKTFGLKVIQSEVKIETLDSILSNYEMNSFELLKIDVEGNEAEALKGLNLFKFRPKVVITEAVDPVTKLRNSSEIRNIMHKSEYIYAYFDGINEYFVSVDEIDLLKNFEQPVSILDGPFFITSNSALTKFSS